MNSGEYLPLDFYFGLLGDFKGHSDVTSLFEIYDFISHLMCWDLQPNILAIKIN